MPENDIYNNKERYENFIRNLELIVIPPDKRTDRSKNKSVYYCKNRNNVKYFKKLAEKFDAKDLSYVRRCRILNTLRLICHATRKDLSECSRDDVDTIVAFMHTRYNSEKSKGDFIRDIRHIWRILFPEKDEKGRIDETICPYPVRHLKPNGDKSREKARKDKLTWDEFEKLVGYLAGNPKMQAYVTLAVESLGRPQEILFTRLKDLELYDNYAKLHISEHGKEGIGILQCIDSFPYMLKWYGQHPFKDNKDAFLFLNENNDQLKPKQINEFLRKALRDLKINKPVTCYSLKRNGVTFARLRGESDVEIQHKARWTSTKQLKTYDLSSQEDSFRIALAKRGLIKDDKYSEFLPKTKTCMFCGFDKVGFSEDTCPKCLHIIDKEKIKQGMDFLNTEAVQRLFKIVTKLQEDVDNIKNLQREKGIIAHEIKQH